jgi:hypothetical protein
MISLEGLLIQQSGSLPHKKVHQVKKKEKKMSQEIAFSSPLSPWKH